MKKKLLVIILLLAVGGGAFYFFNPKDDGEKEKEVNVGEHWNKYATHDNHLVTLNDRMATVAGGAHIAKFTVTIQFKDVQAHDKFMGYEKPLTEKEREKESGSGHGDEEGITPMNVSINSIISDFMMNLGTEEAKNVTYIEENLKTYLNERLGLEKDFIKAVFIEQYVFN